MAQTEIIGGFIKGQPYLVKFFIKLAELGHFLHDFLPHEERRVEHAVILPMQHPEGVIDESLLQEHQRALTTAETGRGKTVRMQPGTLLWDQSSPSGNNLCFRPQSLPSLHRSRRSSPPGRRGSTSSGRRNPPKSAQPCCLHPVRFKEKEKSRRV